MRPHLQRRYAPVFCMRTCGCVWFGSVVFSWSMHTTRSVAHMGCDNILGWHKGPCEAPRQNNILSLISHMQVLVASGSTPSLVLLDSYI